MRCQILRPIDGGRNASNEVERGAFWAQNKYPQRGCPLLMLHRNIYGQNTSLRQSQLTTHKDYCTALLL